MEKKIWQTILIDTVLAVLWTKLACMNALISGTIFVLCEEKHVNVFEQN